MHKDTSDLLIMQPPPPKLGKPVGFFMTHSWWWTADTKYEYTVPEADFDWIAAHGNGDYVAKQLVRPAVVDYGIAFATHGLSDGRWFTPDHAQDTLRAALQKLTPEQFKLIRAFVLVDEPDVQAVDPLLFAQAIAMMRTTSIEVFGYSPPVLIIYSYMAFQTNNWPCFELADLVAFDYYPASYATGGVNNPSAVSPMSWHQMFTALHAKRQAGQKQVVLVETATPRPELTWLLNSNMRLIVDIIRPVAEDVAFIVGFNYQGVVENDLTWIGANKLPDLLWREIL